MAATRRLVWCPVVFISLFLFLVVVATDRATNGVHAVSFFTLVSSLLYGLVCVERFVSFHFVLLLVWYWVWFGSAWFVFSLSFVVSRCLSLSFLCLVLVFLRIFSSSCFVLLSFVLVRGSVGCVCVCVPALGLRPSPTSIVSSGGGGGGCQHRFSRVFFLP